MTNRQQFVNFKCTESHADCFINLQNVSNKLFNIFQVFDDTTMLIEGSCFQYIIATLNNEIIKLNEWL